MDFVNVRATMLDGGRWIIPYVETWTCEKYRWISTPAVHSFKSLTKVTAWEPWMAGLAQRGPRPTVSFKGSQLS